MDMVVQQNIIFEYTHKHKYTYESSGQVEVHRAA